MKFPAVAIALTLASADAFSTSGNNRLAFTTSLKQQENVALFAKKGDYDLGDLGDLSAPPPPPVPEPKKAVKAKKAKVDPIREPVPEPKKEVKSKKAKEYDLGDLGDLATPAPEPKKAVKGKKAKADPVPEPIPEPKKGKPPKPSKPAPKAKAKSQPLPPASKLPKISPPPPPEAGFSLPSFSLPSLPSLPKGSPKTGSSSGVNPLLGVVLGAAPLIAIPAVGLLALRSQLSATLERRDEINRDLAEAELARIKKEKDADIDTAGLLKAGGIFGAATVLLGLIVFQPYNDLMGGGESPGRLQPGIPKPIAELLIGDPTKVKEEKPKKEKKSEAPKKEKQEKAPKKEKVKKLTKAEIEAEKVAAEKAEADKIVAEKAAAEKAEADKIEAEKAAAEKAVADKAAAEQAAIDEAEAAKVAAKSLKNKPRPQTSTSTNYRRKSAAATPAAKPPVVVVKKAAPAIQENPASRDPAKGLGVAGKPGTNPGGKVMAPEPPISQGTLDYIKQYNK